MRRTLAIAAGLVVSALAIPNLIVYLGGRGAVTSNAREVPHAQAALVLGAQVKRGHAGVFGVDTAVVVTRRFHMA